MLPNRRLNIFVSSTSKDLSSHRQAVIRAIHGLGHHAVAMEDFGAVNLGAVEKCLTDVRNSDAYVLVVAWRYGSIPAGSNCSLTELEYREALANHLTILVFLLSEDIAWPPSHIDRARERVEAFRSALMLSHVVAFFDSQESLAREVTAALARSVGPRKTDVPAPVDAILPRLQTAVAAELRESIGSALDLAASLGHDAVYTPHMLYAIASRNDALGKQLREVFALDLTTLTKRIQTRFSSHGKASQSPQQLSDSLVRAFNAADAMCADTHVYYIRIAHLLRAICLSDAEGQQVLSWANIDATALIALVEPYLVKAGFQTPELRGGA